MESIVSLFLILDLSGSMLQSFQGKVKVDTLKSSVSLMTQSYPKALPVNLITYGDAANNSCEQIQVRKTKMSGVAKALGKINPAPFGKTPLSLSLMEMVNSLDLDKKSYGMVITDGNDTCGVDPCATIESLDKRLKKMKGRLSLTILGLDIKSEKNSMECLEKIKDKLSRIKLNFVTAESNDQLNNAILQLDSEIKTSLAKDLETSTLQIEAAPEEANFKLVREGKGDAITWSGEHIVLPVDGRYRLSYLNPNGKTIFVEIKKKDKKIVRFKELLIRTQAKVSFNTVWMKAIIKPEKETARIFDEIKDIRYEGVPLIDNFFIGKYRFHIESPSWLKGVVSEPFEVLPKESIGIDIKNVLSSSISFRKNSTHLEYTAISITTIKKNEKEPTTPDSFPTEKFKYLVPKTIQELPYLKTTNLEFLVGN